MNEKALQHVIQHAELHESIQNSLELIKSGKGIRKYCIGTVGMYADANTTIAWFNDHDLIKFKEWSFIAAKLDRMVLQYDPITWFPAYKFFYALMSDNAEILSWYRQFRLPYIYSPGAIKDRDNPKQPDFHGYQMLLALNGEWDELRQRCKQILSMELKKDKKYLIDHRFYLALANGDQTEMENVLTELTSPKIAKVRNFEQAFAFTENFIGTHAVMYAKLAWIWGYKVEVDTPFIPKEWLPITPLEIYDEPWEFLEEFDIFIPLDDEWTSFSPKKTSAINLIL